MPHPYGTTPHPTISHPSLIRDVAKTRGALDHEEPQRN